MAGLIETVIQNININALSSKELKASLLYLDFLIAEETETNKVITYYRTKLAVMQRLVDLNRNQSSNFS